MALQVSFRLGHYDVTALIGEGGMGQVYRARDTKLDRDVALKVLAWPWGSDVTKPSRTLHALLFIAALIFPASLSAQEAEHPEHHYFELGNFMLELGETYPHGIVRLESALTLITHDLEILAGRDSLSAAGSRAWALHWAAWTRSTEWWRQELFRSPNTPSLEALIEQQSRARPGFRPHDQVVQGRVWQAHDVGDTPGFGGDVERALGSIRAQVIYMPGATDMYFPITDAEYEMQFIPDGEFLPIPSLWGHMAGAGPDRADRAFIIESIRGALR